jgi:hypothetical protein
MARMPAPPPMPGSDDISLRRWAFEQARSLPRYAPPMNDPYRALGQFPVATPSPTIDVLLADAARIEAFVRKGK